MTLYPAKRFRSDGKGGRHQVTRKKSFGVVSNAKNFEAVLGLCPRLVEILQMLFGITPPMWAFALDKMRQESGAYRLSLEPKGPGKAPRKIHKPCQELKDAQRLILQRFLGEIPVHHGRESNRPGSSILTNASKHISARGVFTLDLVDAFPSVWRSRVRTVLRGPLFDALAKQFMDEEFSDDDRAKLLESLLDFLMLNDRLPQGSPCSPRILDLCLFSADAQIWRMLRRHSTVLQHFRFTGYADDYTVSSDGEISEPMQAAIVEILTNLGWRVHTDENKTKYMSPETGEVPMVTGLVLVPDGRITMAPRKVNQIRGRLHRLLKMPEWDTRARGEAAGLHGYVTHIYGNKPPSALREIMAQIKNRMTHPVVPFFTVSPDGTVEPGEDPAAATTTMATDPEDKGKRPKKKGSKPASARRPT